MAKSNGLGMTVFTVQDASGTARDIRNDITNFQFDTPRAVQDTTGIDKMAKETLLLLSDYSITINGVFNPTATTSSHAVLSTVSTTSVTRQIILTFNTTPTATMTATTNLTAYNVTRAASGEATWQTTGVLANGTAGTWS